MPVADLKDVLGTTAQIAQEAGEILMEGYRRGPAVVNKGRIDLVTEYDLRVEEMLRERFAAAFPEHAVVAEEGSDDPGDHKYVWYLDPLDGTTNFAHGHFFFAVSLGLAIDGVPTLGVVHAPALGVTWSGAVGLGANRNGIPCKPSETKSLDQALVATGFPYDRAESEENNLREVAALTPKLRGLRRCGSAALDLALVSDGTYGGYWEQKLKPWDLCAGAALVSAAGGRLSSYEGNAIDLQEGRVVVAGESLHSPLLQALQEARCAF